MNDLIGKINELLDKLNEWEETENHKRGGTYSFLSDSLLVHKLVVSPNVKSRMTNLKTMLITDVLEVHKDKWDSKLSYNTVLEHMKGESTKKYKFKYDVLKKCFLKEVNKEAFLNDSRIMQGNKNLNSLVEECDEWIPYVLLDQLRKTAWELLAKYYFTCNKKFCANCDKKKLLYYKFTQVVALFEICFIEYVQNPIRNLVQKSNELIAEMMEELKGLQGNRNQDQEIITELQEMSEEERYKFAMQMLQDTSADINKFAAVAVDKLNTLTKNFEKITVFSLLEAEFTMELCSILHLLLIFESVNVYNDEVQPQHVGLNLDVWFKSDYNKNFQAFGRTNKNKSVNYNYVNKYLEDILREYTDCSYDVKKIAIAFLEELSAKNEGKEAKWFYAFMCRLALPVYKKLGGGENLKKI